MSRGSSQEELEKKNVGVKRSFFWKLISVCLCLDKNGQRLFINISQNVGELLFAPKRREESLEDVIEGISELIQDEWQ